MNFFSAFLEMFRNSDQFIAHMSAEYGIYVYLFLFTVYFLETGIVICALLPGDSLIFVSGPQAQPASSTRSELSWL